MNTDQRQPYSGSHPSHLPSRSGYPWFLLGVIEALLLSQIVVTGLIGVLLAYDRFSATKGIGSSDFVFFGIIAHWVALVIWRVARPRGGARATGLLMLSVAVLLTALLLPELCASLAEFRSPPATPPESKAESLLAFALIPLVPGALVFIIFSSSARARKAWESSLQQTAASNLPDADRGPIQGLRTSLGLLGLSVLVYTGVLGISAAHAAREANDAVCRVSQTPLGDRILSAREGNADAAWELYTAMRSQGRPATQWLPWLRQVAASGFPDAQHQLAQWMSRPDEPSNIPSFTADASFRHGRTWKRGEKGILEEEAAAVLPCEIAAYQGKAEAQAELADQYRDGRGVPASRNTAFLWLTLAAAQGHARAQNNLGACYQNAEGVGQDFIQAAYWYRRAAEQGNMSAMHNLARCYRHGLGVAPDLGECVRWSWKAALAGHSESQSGFFRLGAVCLLGVGVLALGLLWLFRRSRPHTSK